MKSTKGAISIKEARLLKQAAYDKYLDAEQQLAWALERGVACPQCGGTGNIYYGMSKRPCWTCQGCGVVDA